MCIGYVDQVAQTIESQEGWWWSLFRASLQRYNRCMVDWVHVQVQTSRASPRGTRKEQMTFPESRIRCEDSQGIAVSRIANCHYWLSICTAMDLDPANILSKQMKVIEEEVLEVSKNEKDMQSIGSIRNGRTVSALQNTSKRPWRLRFQGIAQNPRRLMLHSPKLMGKEDRSHFH